ncbi:uncharacterized protein IUM83_11347 [Phytophthora cinnamomi]|uniref:uncharacterized protein n=1 Tax=Phytophthora cinnamomi TaxID=4785 RepID=UPI003559FC0D|nr:hypothetical protein IUM83_11347 [Phytophthora cinnamomi]
MEKASSPHRRSQEECDSATPAPTTVVPATEATTLALTTVVPATEATTLALTTADETQQQTPARSAPATDCESNFLVAYLSR